MSFYINLYFDLLMHLDIRYDTQNVCTADVGIQIDLQRKLLQIDTPTQYASRIDMQ